MGYEHILYEVKDRIATVHDAPAGQALLAHRARSGAPARRTVGAARRGALC